MEYKRYLLKDVCSRLSAGKNIKAANVYETGPFPIYGGNGLRGYSLTSNFKGSCAIIGRQGAYCGNVRYFEGEAHMTEHAVVVQGNELADNYYLSCLLSELHLERLSGQSAQPGLAVGTLAVQEIDLPGIDDQRRIASILSSLDRKIELNNKINAQLEEMAQAIFKSWFVDFEPFKDGKFVESELGLIPEGWRVGTLGEYAKLKSGFAFKSSWWKDKGCKIIKIKNITESGELDLSDCSYVDSVNTIKAKEFRASKGNVIIAMTGATIGKFCIIPEIKNTYINQRVGKFFTLGEPMECLPFLFNTLKQERIYNEIINRGQGSAQPNISGKDVDTLSIIIPTEDIISHYNKLAKSFFEKILSNKQQNLHLAQLRDTLLPKLMNGEIEI